MNKNKTSLSFGQSSTWACCWPFWIADIKKIKQKPLCLCQPLTWTWFSTILDASHAIQEKSINGKALKNDCTCADNCSLLNSMHIAQTVGTNQIFVTCKLLEHVTGELWSIVRSDGFWDTMLMYPSVQGYYCRILYSVNIPRLYVVWLF